MILCIVLYIYYVLYYLYIIIFYITFDNFSTVFLCPNVESMGKLQLLVLQTSISSHASIDLVAASHSGCSHWSHWSHLRSCRQLPVPSSSSLSAQVREGGG